MPDDINATHFVKVGMIQVYSLKRAPLVSIACIPGKVLHYLLIIFLANVKAMRRERRRPLTVDTPVCSMILFFGYSKPFNLSNFNFSGFLNLKIFFCL